MSLDVPSGSGPFRSLQVPSGPFRSLQVPSGSCFGWFQIWVTHKHPLQLWWYSSFFLWKQDPFDRKLPFTQNVNVFSDPSQSKIFPLVLLLSNIFSSSWGDLLTFLLHLICFHLMILLHFHMKNCLFLWFQQFIFKLKYAKKSFISIFVSISG